MTSIGSNTDRIPTKILFRRRNRCIRDSGKQLSARWVTLLRLSSLGADSISGTAAATWTGPVKSGKKPASRALRSLRSGMAETAHLSGGFDRGNPAHVTAAAKQGAYGDPRLRKIPRR